MNELKSGTVLVVEDDETIVFSIGEVLKLAGYAVQSAENGLRALDLVQKEGIPDLILLDMKMPIMDGWQFAAEFKARHDHQAPIVVMTAAADAKKRADEIRADGWISKPFNLDGILECAKKFVRARPAS